MTVTMIKKELPNKYMYCTFWSNVLNEWFDNVLKATLYLNCMWVNTCSYFSQ